MVSRCLVVVGELAEEAPLHNRSTTEQTAEPHASSFQTQYCCTVLQLCCCYISVSANPATTMLATSTAEQDSTPDMG